MNWNKITYKYYYLYKKKISQIVFIFEEKTPHEYDSGTSRNQIRWEKSIKKKKVLFARLILTKDDILKYCDEEEDTSFIKLKRYYQCI